jgi:two-component system cell cycle response regulator CpdR
MPSDANLTPVVAVIEDEPLIQLELESAFEEAGGVKSAPNAKAAVAMLEQEIDACSVIVTDIRLARDSLTGWDIARLAREMNPEIKVVYITGDSGSEWPTRGVSKSVLIHKPFDAREVVSAVSRLLESD